MTIAIIGLRNIGATVALERAVGGEEILRSAADACRPATRENFHLVGQMVGKSRLALAGRRPNGFAFGVGRRT
jgi:hypothetical protein